RRLHHARRARLLCLAVVPPLPRPRAAGRRQPRRLPRPHRRPRGHLARHHGQVSSRCRGSRWSALRDPLREPAAGRGGRDGEPLPMVRLRGLAGHRQGSGGAERVRRRLGRAPAGRGRPAQLPAQGHRRRLEKPLRRRVQPALLRRRRRGADRRRLRDLMDPVYVVTDIEVNGPTPGAHSMLAFASVALDPGGDEVDTFEAVLETLPEAGEDRITIEWFKGFPDAWAAATANPQPPQAVMERYANWVGGLPGQ